MPLTLSLPRVAAVGLACLLVGGAAPTAYAVLDAGERPAGTAASTTSTTASTTSTTASAGGRAYVETRLFFGTVRPDGGPAVTEGQFRKFVDDVVTPRFPEGLTVQDGYGQYRDAHGTIERERSYELVLYYPVADAPENDGPIERIRERYMAKFGQESVARVDDRARVDF